MTKHEAPPFRMVIEGGRMVPATAYDAERLDSYRRGTRIIVRITAEKDRVMVRKWFAILGKAVKECSTPWKNKDEASEAVKLALGIVNLTKTVGGAWMQYPKSLTELTDPELDEAVEQMMALIYKITGVDPADWKKEIADVGEDEPEPASAHSPGEDAAGSGDATPRPAADQSVSTQESGPEADSVETQADPAVLSASDLVLRNKMQECLDKFMEAATDPKLDAKGRQETVIFAKNIWKEEIKDRLDFVKACTDTANKVVKGAIAAEDARAELARWLP